MAKLHVRDSKTKDSFFLDPSVDRAIIVTSDGERVKVHPVVIRQFVKVGETFDGNGRVGPRVMERMK